MLWPHAPGLDSLWGSGPSRASLTIAAREVSSPERGSFPRSPSSDRPKRSARLQTRPPKVCRPEVAFIKRLSTQFGFSMKWNI